VAWSQLCDECWINGFSENSQEVFRGLINITELSCNRMPPWRSPICSANIIGESCIDLPSFSTPDVKPNNEGIETIMDLNYPLP
jgi:hypothetical protein